MSLFQVIGMYACVHVYLCAYVCEQVYVWTTSQDWQKCLQIERLREKTQIYNSMYIKLSGTLKSIQAILLGVIYAGD